MKSLALLVMLVSLSSAPSIACARDPFDMDAIGTGQLQGLRALFEGARPVEGSITHGVLVCAATVRGSGYDDSFFGGGPDVALRMRLGRGPLIRTPQTAQRLYSMPAPSLASGETVWVRVVDEDVFFDDIIAEGSTRYERTPFTLTMGQADVECRAVDPARVERGARVALDDLDRAIARLPQPAPDLSARDLGYASAPVSAVIAAAADVAAWTGSSDPRLESALEPAHAWSRGWDRALEDAVASASATLPTPGTALHEGATALSVARLACGGDAAVLRAEIGDAASPAAPTTGCIALLHLEHAPAHALAPSAPGTTWALHDDGAIALATVSAVRVGGQWRSPEATPRVSGTYDVALALEAGDAGLLRVGAPFAHAQVLRLR